MKIERGIPLTDSRGIGRSPKRPMKYPWPKMKVGDSFFADIEPDALRAAAYKYGKRHGLTFIVRKDGEGARAWRTA